MKSNPRVKRLKFVKLRDGRVFPVYAGEALSRVPGSSFTPQDEAEGSPRTKAVLSTLTKAELLKEYRSALKDALNRMWPAAERYFQLVRGEVRRRGIKSYRDIFGDVQINPRQSQVDYRLREIAEMGESGATEMTGKVKRNTSGEIVGRFGGGMSIIYPELATAGVGPKQAREAIRRGKGKVYNRLRRATERELGRTEETPRRRSPGRPTVPGHPGNKKCRHCGAFHATGQHRFHGEGAFHRTHLFSFNPPTVVYPATKGVVMQGMRKGPGHPCDAQCKRLGHRFRHEFREPVEVIGLPNGDVLLRPRRR